jgi:hypothetical protein
MAKRIKQGDTVQAVNPRTGQWEAAEVVEPPHKVGLTNADRETVAVVRFADGRSVEQPTWAIDKK